MLLAIQSAIIRSPVSGTCDLRRLSEARRLRRNRRCRGPARSSLPGLFPQHPILAAFQIAVIVRIEFLHLTFQIAGVSLRLAVMRAHHSRDSRRASEVQQMASPASA